MATQTTPDTSEGGFLEQLWDALGDRVTAVSEWTSRVLLRVFGTSNAPYIRRLGYPPPGDPKVPPPVTPGSFLARVNELEPQMQALSDEELRQMTPKFRVRFARGETLDDLLPEAFAACREAGR